MKKPATIVIASSLALGLGACSSTASSLGSPQASATSASRARQAPAPINATAVIEALKAKGQPCPLTITHNENRQEPTARPTRRVHKQGQFHRQPDWRSRRPRTRPKGSGRPRRQRRAVPRPSGSCRPRRVHPAGDRRRGWRGIRLRLWWGAARPAPSSRQPRPSSTRSRWARSWARARRGDCPAPGGCPVQP